MRMKKKGAVISILQREKNVKANNTRKKLKTKERPGREKEAALNLKLLL